MLSPALLVLVACGPVIGQLSPLEKDPSYQAGLRHLEDEVLPVEAATHFEKALTRFAEDEKAGARIRLRLGEALARAARDAKDPAKTTKWGEAAVTHLNHGSLKDSDEASFWAAQALLAMGQFHDAAERLSRLAKSPNEKLRKVATRSRARLLAALGLREEALVALESLEESKDKSTAAEARILRASLFLLQDDPDAASELLEAEVPSDRPVLSRYREYLLAQLAVARGNHEDAANRFGGLAADPIPLNLALYHGAVLGQARALHHLERTEEATDVLIGFVDRNPNPPLLNEAMLLLAQWALVSESVRKRFEERLQAWSGTLPLEAYRDTQRPPDLRELSNLVGSNTASSGPALHPSRGAHALYRYALLLAHKNDPDSVALAKRLLARLRAEHPTHPLADLSLLETARLHRASNRPDAALSALETLGRLGTSPALRAEAARLTGYMGFEEGRFDVAARAFRDARRLLGPQEAEALAVNEAICLLQAGKDHSEFGALLDALDTSRVTADLRLEQILVKASKGEDVRDALDSFLRENATNPRVDAARLAHADLALRASPLDADTARSQLQAVDAARLPDHLALKHLLIHLRLAEHFGEWADAIAAANRFLAERESENGLIESDIRLKLAEAYYLNGDYNKARLLFLPLAGEDAPEQLREVALFYAAKSALKVQTDKARDDALALLQRVIEINGLLAREAGLLLAHTLIETDPGEAIEILLPFTTEDSSGPVHLDALILAAEAHIALGGREHYEEAVRIYDRVLTAESLPYPLSNRIHSLRGHVYERLGDPEKALQSYYRVVNRENLTGKEEQSEWYWYYDCGFNALRLRRAAGKWHSALQIARRLATSGGPRAGEAAKLADGIQLEHMIWDEGEAAKPPPDSP